MELVIGEWIYILIIGDMNWHSYKTLLNMLTPYWQLPSWLGLWNTLTAPLQRVRPNRCHRYDSKQSDDEVLVMLELWGMQSTPSLLSLPGPLWPWVVAPDRVLSMSQIELNYILMLNWIAQNRTVFISNCV